MTEISDLPAWLLVLLPVAGLIVAIWLLFSCRHSKTDGNSRFTSEYYKGLDYLLNDEQDKALDVFVRLVESDWETIDTHFALGKIFRKNGEIDKAIKIHQGLIARPSLPERYRVRVLLELGYDYLGAGWFDRAEGLFREVLSHDTKSEKALRSLILIYQQEKDWHKAIDTAEMLYDDSPAEMGTLISQYFCELADVARGKGDMQQLEQHASNALRYDDRSVRASMILAEAAMRSGQYRKALAHYENVEKQDAEFLPLILENLVDCYQQLGETDDLLGYLNGLEQRQKSMPLFTSWTRIIERYKGRDEVIGYVSERLRKSPSLQGISQLLRYSGNDCDENTRSIIGSLKTAVDIIQSEETRYLCRQCGFRTNTLYWLCPSCNTWSTVKPNITRVSAA
jgi:lipopolysaccharide biosynthesis regulator YciM